jgi:hypothetical protein
MITESIAEMRKDGVRTKILVQQTSEHAVPYTRQSLGSEDTRGSPHMQFQK